MASSAATAVDSLALFKTKVSSSAVYGVAIAATSVLVATIASSAIPTGEISLGGIIAIQRDNVALWVLDLMPFIYAFWGQRVTKSPD